LGARGGGAPAAAKSEATWCGVDSAAGSDSGGRCDWLRRGEALRYGRVGGGVGGGSVGGGRAEYRVVGRKAASKRRRSDVRREGHR